MIETAHARGLRLAAEKMTIGRARELATRMAHGIEMRHAESEFADADYAAYAERINGIQLRATGVGHWGDTMAEQAAALRLLVRTT